MLKADLLQIVNNKPSTGFNLNLADNELVWHVGAYAVASIQMKSAISVATVNIQRSNDAKEWFALETPQDLGPLSDMSTVIDTAGFLYLRIVCGDTAAGTADFIALGKATL